MEIGFKPTIMPAGLITRRSEVQVLAPLPLFLRIKLVLLATFPFENFVKIIFDRKY